MSKYKAGDKIVLDVLSNDDNGWYRIGGEYYSWWENPSCLDKVSEPLSEYTEKLEKKNENKQKRIEKLVERLHRQAAEITRLLAENAELKKGREAIRDNAFEAGLIRGQEEARELMIKMGNMYCYDLEKIFGSSEPCDIITNLSYQKVAAKVAEWERKKEEICVGDVVECEEHYGVVVGVGEVYVKGFTSDWTPFQWMKQSCTKTGRHIDVASMMAQIGGESDE